MMGVLLESRAARQRRAGGAVLSTALHVAIIGAVAATAVHGAAAPPPPAKVETIHFAKLAPKAVVIHDPQPSAAPMLPTMPMPVQIHTVVAPTVVPIGLPSFSVSGPPSDSVVIGGRDHESGGTGRTLDILGKGGGDDAWDAREIFTHVLTTVAPHYPESLRNAGIDGRVLVQFVVDTTGRVDMSTVKFLSTTHDLFSRSVRDALPNFRFRPAESGGRRIPVLAQMPFEFQVRP
jgi:periplasmic protein TonB